MFLGEYGEILFREKYFSENSSSIQSGEIFMFYKSGILLKSSIIENYSRFGIRHGFSTREGGVSTLPHTRSLNLTMKLGDSDETVVENISVFVRAVTDNAAGADSAVIASQIHSDNVRLVDHVNRGEGTVKPRGEDGDGFCTDAADVFPIVRAADCTPIVFCGLRADFTPVVAAVHAGWRGTAAGIAGEAVRKMLSLGAEKETIAAAIGPHIGLCCYEVGEDFYESVKNIAGGEFASRHIVKSPGDGDGKYHADLTEMNREIIISSGVREEMIDISRECTMCDTVRFFSHRGMRGKRGTQGACIGIL